LAIDSAALVYCAALSALPVFSASAAMISAWRAVELSFWSSAILPLRRISACFWLAMTLVACSLSRRCCPWDSAMACSSWIFGSAFSLNVPVSFAVRYFHHLRASLNMARSLLARASSEPGQPISNGGQFGRAEHDQHAE